MYDWKNGGKKRKRKTKEEISRCDERNSGRKMDGCANKKWDEEQRRMAFHGCPHPDGYGTTIDRYVCISDGDLYLGFYSTFVGVFAINWAKHKSSVMDLLLALLQKSLILLNRNRFFEKE